MARHGDLRHHTGYEIQVDSQPGTFPLRLPLEMEGLQSRRLFASVMLSYRHLRQASRDCIKMTWCESMGARPIELA